MIYKYIPATAILQGYVKNYLVAHFVFDKNMPVPCKPYSPKPEQGITFFPRGRVSLTNPQTGESFDAPRVSIFGQQVSRYDFHLTREYLMFRVHFHPGALHCLLNTPLCEFTNRYSDAELVINHEVYEVNERLGNCKDYNEMVEIVESYLISKLKKIKKEPHPIDQVGYEMLANPRRFSLDELSRQAFLSPRQFNRKFTERMGVGPKTFSRIIRFCEAYQFKEQFPAEDWLSVAVKFGYADYQHLVKDFKQFANVTPVLWIHEDKQSPERLLNLE